MNQAQQEYLEPEHMVDDDQWWQMFADLFEDVSDTVPAGSLIVLILLGVLTYKSLPYIVQIAKAWRK